MKKEFKSRHEGYKIIVTYHPNKDSDFFVRAHAVDRNYDRVDKCKDVKRRVNNKEGLETIIIFARNSVDTQLDHIFRAKKPQTVGEELVETPFNIAFNKVQNLDSSFFPWAETYKKNVLTYSRRNIVPWFAKNVEDRFTMIESQDLQEFLAEKIKKHGNFRGTHEDALAGAAIHLNAFKETYSLMQSIDSSLPDISFNVFTKNTRYRVEQPKSISPECHLAFRHNVEKHIDTDPIKARGAALMDNGLRTGEASAVTKDMIIQIGHIVLVKVLFQEHEGKKSCDLKSKDSYRTIVLDEWGSWIVIRCNQLIIEEDSADNDLAPIVDSELSSWVKARLIESGVEEYLFMEAYKYELKHPRYDSEGRPVIDVSAHLLRRNRSSIQCNICGYTSVERDVALGHKKKANRYAYSNPQWDSTFVRIIEKNSLYDISENLSNNPKYKPIILTQDDKKDVHPYPIYRLVNNGNIPLKIDINLLTCELGEDIIMVGSKFVKVDMKQRSECKDGKRRYENLIGGVKYEK